ncbi:MAG: S8 family peptidase [Acidobacteria bacterium]|nr:S8 family peptidase [Acidobacteriota bacterium]
MSLRFLLLLVAASVGWGRPHPKIARDLEGADPNGTVDVIIQYAKTPETRHADRLRQHGGRARQALGLVNGMVATVPVSKLAELADDPEVAMISQDHEVTGTLDHTVGSINGYTLSNALGSTVYVQGTGVAIAFIDSGIQASHQDFLQYGSTSSRVVYSQSFIDSNPADLYGHGTHVIGIGAGMDAANSASSRPFWGIAPASNIVSLKVLDANGKGTDSAVIAAINKAIALKSTYNIRVINLSLGRPVTASYKNDPLCQAVEAAWKAGIVVVVAAGNNGRDNTYNNNGYGTITAPGNDPYVITVGAVNSKGNYDRSDDTIATYSSKGPTPIDHFVKPDLVAPGNRVVSDQASGATLETTYPANIPATNTYLSSGSTAPSPYYFTLSGTSMATPVVSGAAALLIYKNPNLTPDQVKAILMKTAWRGFPTSTSTFDSATNKTYVAYHDAFTVGAGLLDVYAAYTSTETPTGVATSPMATYNSTSKTVSISMSPLVSGTTIVWGTSGPYATSIVWGTNVQGTTLVWGTTIVWGTSTMQGFSVVWGTGSPWACSNPSGESVTIAIKGEN